MKPSYYVLHTGTQDIILQKNLINPSLYWGQRMSQESLEKEARTTNASGFHQAAIKTNNPQSAKNGIFWSSSFPVKTTVKNSPANSGFKPLTSVITPEKTTINLRRKFRHIKSKSLMTSTTDSQFLKPRGPELLLVNTPKPFESIQSNTSASPKKSDDNRIVALSGARTKAGKKLNNLINSEHMFSLKQKTFEKIANMSSLKKTQTQDVLSFISKLKAESERKLNASDVSKEPSIVQNHKRRAIGSHSSSMLKRSLLSLKEPKEWLGGFLPFSFPSSQKKSDETKYKLGSDVALISDLDSLNSEITTRQAVTTGRTQLETTKVMFFGRDVNALNLKISMRGNHQRLMCASERKGTNSEVDGASSPAKLKTLLSTERYTPSRLENPALDDIAKQLELAELNLANENAIFTRSSFAKSFRDHKEAKIKVKQLQNLY